jgi:hypothetical protein
VRRIAAADRHADVMPQSREVIRRLGASLFAALVIGVGVWYEPTLADGLAPSAAPKALCAYHLLKGSPAFNQLKYMRLTWIGRLYS